MIECAGIMLPDGESHLQRFLLDTSRQIDGIGTYQQHKFAAAMEVYKARPPIQEGFPVAYDIGAHVGLWTMHMLRAGFRHIEAFEPILAHRECFNINVAKVKRAHQSIELWPMALGAEVGDVEMHTDPTSSGDTYPVIGAAAGKPNAVIGTIDNFCLDRAMPDFIKIDCEGYEYFIIQGGEQTIKQARPVMVVEQKKGKAEKYALKRTQAIDLLKEWGAVVDREMSGDFILHFPS